MANRSYVFDSDVPRYVRDYRAYVWGELPRPKTGQVWPAGFNFQKPRPTTPGQAWPRDRRAMK